MKMNPGYTKFKSKKCKCTINELNRSGPHKFMDKTLCTANIILIYQNVVMLEWNHG